MLSPRQRQDSQILECAALRPRLSRLQWCQVWLNSGDLPWLAFASKAHILDYSREQNPRQVFLLGLYCHSTKTVRENGAGKSLPAHPKPGDPAMAFKTFEITGPVKHTLVSKVPCPDNVFKNSTEWMVSVGPSLFFSQEEDYWS